MLHRLVLPTPNGEPIVPDSSDLTPYDYFLKRRAMTDDDARPDALAKRRTRGGRSARENLLDLLEGGDFIEYGQFAVAAQRSRRDASNLRTQTAGDGVLTAIGKVNASNRPTRNADAALIINDYTVLAGTQGYFHHQKVDRMIGLAREQRLPVIMYTEGGGGRPGDTDVLVSMGGLNLPTFHSWAALTGVVPRIGVNHGFCFAGNAALFGAADLRIATRDSFIGMAGPAMIEGGGLGSYSATEIGPVKEHLRNGVVDILVKDEAEATALARKALGYCQGNLSHFTYSDQSALRIALPANRRMAYDVRKILNRVFDTDSLLEIRAEYGRALIGGLARIGGQPVAVLASDCRHLGGAIDAEAASKAADLFKLARNWQLPVISFVDTPGFMVGPASETAGAPKHMSEMFVAGAQLGQPLVAVFLRRGYGLGAMAMTGGSFAVPVYAASWPEGEFGPMGLEGAVHLGFKQELAQVPEGPERDALYQKLLAEMYERGRATEAASYLEIDAVIDPADTRSVILQALDCATSR